MTKTVNDYVLEQLERLSNSKLKGEEYGQHSDCNICFIKDIETSTENEQSEINLHHNFINKKESFSLRKIILTEKNVQFISI